MKIFNLLSICLLTLGLPFLGGSSYIEEEEDATLSIYYPDGMDFLEVNRPYNLSLNKKGSFDPREYEIRFDPYYLSLDQGSITTEYVGGYFYYRLNVRDRVGQTSVCLYKNNVMIDELPLSIEDRRIECEVVGQSLGGRGFYGDTGAIVVDSYDEYDSVVRVTSFSRPLDIDEGYFEEYNLVYAVITVAQYEDFLCDFRDAFVVGQAIYVGIDFRSKRPTEYTDFYKSYSFILQVKAGLASEAISDGRFYYEGMNHVFLK